MRCLACNKNLNDLESTRKYATSNEYVDLCNDCFSTIAEDILVIENQSLKETSEDESDLQTMWQKDEHFRE